MQPTKRSMVGTATRHTENSMSCCVCAEAFLLFVRSDAWNTKEFPIFSSSLFYFHVSLVRLLFCFFFFTLWMRNAVFVVILPQNITLRSSQIFTVFSYFQCFVFCRESKKKFVAATVSKCKQRTCKQKPFRRTEAIILSKEQKKKQATKTTTKVEKEEDEEKKCLFGDSIRAG